ncbi:MAG: helix-turn-helix transcriptional regulator [Dyella sp.]|uniref:helix-turn-helix transcriptional regulator n=1 Tax=Dyella sp. TaxID=1869338 RepID=UPI003F8216A4
MLQLEATLERTGMDAQTLREVIAAGDFPAAIELDGCEVWDEEAVRTWCDARGRPPAAKRQASMDRLIDAIAADAVSEYTRTSNARRETQR